MMRHDVQELGSIEEAFYSVAQEVSVLLVVAVSFLFWKHIQRRSLRGSTPLKPSSKTIGGKALQGSQQVSVVKLAADAGKRQPAGAFKKTAAPTSEALQEAEQNIMQKLAHREFTAALNLYRQYERDGLANHFTSEKMYSLFIQSAVRVGKLDVVDKMLDHVVRNQMAPTVEFWHSTLKMLSSRKQFSTCLHIFDVYPEIIPNDKVILSCLINAALECGVPEQSKPMLARYKECGLDAADHVTAFRAYVALGAAEDAVELLRKMQGGTSVLMVNLVLLCLINKKMPERALEVLREVHVWERSSRGGRLADVVSYNTVVKGFVQSGDLAKCFECVQSMQDYGLEPDDVTLTTMLESCLVDQTSMDDLVGLLKRTDRKTPIDIGTCNLFIKGLLRVDGLPKAAELYEALKQSAVIGCAPNVVTYSMLIRAYVDQKDVEKALHVLSDMGAAGHMPDEIIFSHLLEGCRLVGNHALGVRIFEDMLKSGVVPTEYTLTNMVKLHGRCRALEDAYQLVAEWESKFGQKPTVIHYTCLMSGCLRQKSYDLAWAAYELMEKQKVRPDETTLGTLLPAMAQAKQWARVARLGERAAQLRGSVRLPRDLWKMALEHLEADPEASAQAVAFRLAMGQAGVSGEAAATPSGTAHPWSKPTHPWSKSAREPIS